MRNVKKKVNGQVVWTKQIEMGIEGLEVQLIPNWTNNGGIYMVPRSDKVDQQQIKGEMDALEAKLQIAEVAIAAREGRTA